MALTLVENVEGKRVWRDERNQLIKEDHTVEDKIKKMMYSKRIDDIKMALKVVEKQKDKLDVLYIFDMQRVEPGFFYAGSDKVRTEIKDAFYMCKFVTTQGLWQAVMDNNPAAHTGDLRLPIENISFDEAEEFMKKLSEISGIQFRIPMQEEWEYTADGGSNMPKDENGDPIQDLYSGFSDISEIDEYAWHAENSGGQTQPVGMLKPNKMGIYDMTGLVFEWVWSKE